MATLNVTMGGNSMDIGRLTVDEFIALLRDGNLEPEAVPHELLVQLGARGVGRPRSLIPHESLTWPTPGAFWAALQPVLATVAWPPEQQQLCDEMGCDRKTMMKHLRIHFGIHSWREFIQRLSKLLLAVAKPVDN